MKRSFLKLLGAALALCLVLSGCNLIKVDEIMQLQEDMKALEKDEAKVLVDYDGGQITLGDVKYDYNYQVSYMNALYSTYGLTYDASMAESSKEDILKSHMNTRATLAKAEELGIALTDEELQECETEAENSYKEQYDSYIGSNATGETEEIRALETEYALRQSGMTKDMFLYAQKADKLIGKVEEQIMGEVTEVTEDQVKSAFDTKVAEDEAKYETDTATFENDRMQSEDEPYWYPEGYRTVKHILVIPEESYMTAVTEKQTELTNIQNELTYLERELATYENEEKEAEEGEETDSTHRPKEDVEAEMVDVNIEIEKAQAALDEVKAEALASVQEKIDEIVGRLNNGEDFQALIDEYGEDPGMQNEPTMSRGYYVSEGTTTLDAAFKETALALEKVGDVSEPIVGQSGVHIIRYETDVPAGAIDLETVREALTEEVLENAKQDHYDEQLASWVEALHPVYHLDAWK